MHDETLKDLLASARACAEMLREDGYERGTAYQALKQTIRAAEAIIEREGEAKVFEGYALRPIFDSLGRREVGTSDVSIVLADDPILPDMVHVEITVRRVEDK